MFWLLIVGIVVIGLIFIIAEVLVVPGGILGVIGGLLLVYAIYLPYAEGFTIGGHINLAVIILVLALSLFGSIKSGTWSRLALKANIDSKAREYFDANVNVGDRGTSISRLTPIGKARFEDNIIEVKSFVGFVDQNTEIEIIDIEKDKVIVKPLNT